MTETDEAARGNKRIWARTKFDLEGIGGAAAALLVGVLLGWLWSPLFWIGFVGAIAILMATRAQTRVPPELANLVIAPCDGIVHSIARALPPTELRLEGGEWLRLRISSSPFVTNPIYSSLNGEISSIIMEEPDSSVFTAAHPELPGLAVAYINLSSLGQHIGCAVATGGFGPRLEMVSEAGDPIRMGRVIGKRRLGGWCDVYLAAGSKFLVSEGQTLIGAETVLCRLVQDVQAPEVEAETPEVETVEEAVEETLEEVGQADDDAPSALEELAAEESPREASDVDEETETDTSAVEEAVEEAVYEGDEDEISDPEDAVAELFKKLTDNENKKP